MQIRSFLTPRPSAEPERFRRQFPQEHADARIRAIGDVLRRRRAAGLYSARIWL